MSSGFSGGVPDFFTGGGRSTSRNGSYNTNLNQEQQFPFPSPLPGVLLETAGQIRRPNFIGKRSLADFQQQNQGFYLRNVKLRPNYQHASVPSFSPEVSPMNSRYGLPILQQLTVPSRNVNSLSTSFSSQNLVGNKGNVNMGTSLSGPGSEVFGYESEKKMMSQRLQQLEKELLGDDEEDDGEAASVVTSSEWSETIQNLITPNEKSISFSPTSSSSSCCSTSASPPIPCTKQSLVDAAAAISDGRFETAAEILTRLQHVANPRGTSEQRVTAYMVLALKSRISPTEHASLVSELHAKEHTMSTQMLYDVSPCFKLGFMAANLAILEAAASPEQGLHKIHVVDFDIGQGGQYMHLLHALAAKKSDGERAAVLKITALTDCASGDEDNLRIVGQRLKALADKIDVCLNFSVKKLNFDDLNREKLGVEPAESLAVNFAFKLHKLPDESVTTENLRDEMLRRTKGLSPVVMTVVEQDMNANTAPLTVRVRATFDHYGALFDSLEATVPSPNRIRVEEALGRRMGNSVECEGRQRVERCEVFGKWRARMSMAGFQPVHMSQPVAELLRAKLNSGARGNPGFTVNEESGGICFGWMGRTLAVASAWR